MSRRLAVLTVGAVACGNPAPSPVGPGPGVHRLPDGGLVYGRVPEPAPPTLKLPAGFVPTGYTADLKLDPARPTFHGELEIRGELAAPASLIWLDAEGLTITAATADGVAAEVVAQPHDFVGLRLAADAAAGPITLHLSYDGAIATQDTYGVFVEHDGGKPYLFTQMEPLGARRVFPCVDEPWSKAPWTVSITAPADQLAVANAPEASRELLADGLARTTFAETAALPTYLLAFGVGPFEIVDAGATRGGAPIRIIAFDGRGAEAAWAAKVTPQIVEILEDWFGTPYPFAKLDSLAIPETVGFGAMENAGLITYREGLLLLPEDASEDDRRDYVLVAGHEVSHQWFGDLVTPAWWDDLWLNEAFATWMEEKVMATFSPAWSLRTPVVVARSNALEDDGLVTARMIRQPIDRADDIDDAFDGITYGKGAAVIRMFEKWIGPEAFQAGVRAYLTAHAGATATADDFLAALDAATELDVTAAFRTFLDQAGAPRVTAEVTCPESKKDKTPPALTLRQERWLPRGSTAPAGTAPRWQIPVCVAYGASVKERKKACTLLAEESVTLPLEGKCPKWLLPNADGAGYFRTGVSQDLLEDLLGTGWSQLRPHERVLLAGDVRAEVARGGLPIGAELDLVRKLAKDATPHSIAIAVEIAREALAVASDASRPAMLEWIRDTFARRAQKLGFLPDEGEELDAELMREELVPLVAEIGRDPKLLARSVELSKKPKQLGEGTRAMVLRVAVTESEAVAKDVLAAAQVATEVAERTELFDALSALQDPELAEQAMALLLDDRVDHKAAADLLIGLASHPAVQPTADAWLRKHVDALVARMPAELAPELVEVVIASCDAAKRDDAATWAQDKLATLPGGARTVAQAIERMDQCIARKAAVGPELDAWLAAR